MLYAKRSHQKSILKIKRTTVPLVSPQDRTGKDLATRGLLIFVTESPILYLFSFIFIKSCAVSCLLIIIIFRHTLYLYTSSAAVFFLIHYANYGTTGEAAWRK